MNYKESIATIKKAVTGDYALIMERAGVSKPTIVSAFAKESPNELTPKEARAIEVATQLARERAELHSSVLTTARQL